MRSFLFNLSFAEIMSQQDHEEAQRGNDLRTNPSQEEGNDANQNTASKDPIQIPIRPVTRAQVKKFKDILNGLIQGVWAQANS